MTVRNAPIDGVEKRNFSLHKQVGQYQTEWHSHACHQLLYAEGGVLHLQTEYHHFLLPARHGAWIPSALPHRVWSNSPALYLRTLYFVTGDDDEDLLQQLRVFSISNLAREMILYTQDWDETSPPNLLEQHFFETLRLLVGEWLNQAIPLVLPSTDHPQVGNIAGLFSSKNSVHVIARERSGRSNLRPATRGLLRQNTPRNDIQPQN